MITGIREYCPQRSLKPLMNGFLEQQGVVLHDADPAPLAVLVSASLSDGTLLCFDLRVWLERALPTKGLVNIALIPPGELLSYFRYLHPRLQLTLPGVSEVLENISPLEGSSPLSDTWPLAIDARFAQVWLKRYPEACREACRSFSRQPVLDRLTGTLMFSTGSSYLSARELNRLECEDVLLINNSLRELIVNNHVLAIYCPLEEGIMIEETVMSADAAETFNAQASGAKQVPVKLHFVVHEMVMSLHELSELQAGDVLPCAPFEDKHISVYANGTLLAKGELVMIEGRPGVEIQTLE
jgi:type III secretion system YscQ/HrcQ family protein